jgi:hypothetical protein
VRGGGEMDGEVRDYAKGDRDLAHNTRFGECRVVGRELVVRN